MAWNYPLTFDSKEPFCACVVFSLILYSDRVLPLFVLARIIPWRCLQETKTDSPFLLLLQFPSANGIGCIFLNWNLPMLPQEMKRRGWLIANFQPGAHLSPTSLVPSTVEMRMKLEYSQTPHTRISSKWDKEFQKNIYFCFTDYAKAFDCVDHNKLWKILNEMGIPDHLICLLQNLYVGQEATIRMGHGTTDWFKIGKGVCQGCILSLCLFNLYAEYIMQNIGLGWSTNWDQDCWEKYQ